MVSRRNQRLTVRKQPAPRRGRQSRSASKRKQHRTRKGGTKDKGARHRCTVPGCDKSYKNHKHLLRHRRDKHSGRTPLVYSVERRLRGLSPRAIASRELAKVHKWLAGPIREFVVNQLVGEGWGRADATKAVVDAIVRISADPTNVTLGPAWKGIHGAERQRDRKALLAGVLRTEALRTLQFVLKAGDTDTNREGAWNENLWEKGEQFSPRFEQVLKSDELYLAPSSQPSDALVQATNLSSYFGDVPVDSAITTKAHRDAHDPPEPHELPSAERVNVSIQELPPPTPKQLFEQQVHDARVARAVASFPR